jgi:HlyD family secretion protein
MSKPSRSRGLLSLLLLVVVAAGVWYYYQRDRAPKPVFTTATVSRGSISQVVTATGTLQPVTSVEVGSQISGLVTEVLVDYNSPVKTGQLIARIDASTYEQRLRQAEADLASAQANHALVQLNTERTRALRQRNLVSQQELDQANAQLAQADANVLTREAAVVNARVDLARCSIFSPIDGIVIDRQVDVGKTVAASFNAPVLFIIANDLANMQINAAISEADIGSLEAGMAVNFTVDAFPGRMFRGRVQQIRNSPKIEQNVVTYQTIIAVGNEDLRLKPGMTANVSIVIAQRENAVRVPNAALRARIPESLLPPPPAPVAGTASPAPAAPVPATREQMIALMREAGFTPGSGPPSPEVRERMAQLAKERGLELPAMGGGRRAERSGEAPAVTTRTVYKFGGTPEKPVLTAVSVKLGITDGSNTEVIEGLAEGDVLVASVIIPGASGTSPAPGAASPFGSPRRF